MWRAVTVPGPARRRDERRSQRQQMKGPLALALLAISSVTAVPAAVELHVCCGCGDDSEQRGYARTSPLNTLRAAQDRVVALRTAAKGASGSINVYTTGVCEPPRTFGPEDGGVDEESRVVYRGYPGESPTIVTGGVPVPASALQPVTGPDYVINQINQTALPFIRKYSQRLQYPGFSYLPRDDRRSNRSRLAKCHRPRHPSMPSLHGGRGIDSPRQSGFCCTGAYVDHRPSTQ